MLWAMRIAILGFKSMPTTTQLGTRKAGGQSLNIFHMLKSYTSVGLQPHYFDWVMQGDLLKPTGSLDDFSLPFRPEDCGLIDPYSHYISHELGQARFDVVHTCGAFAGDAFRIARTRNRALREMPWVHSNFATISQRLYTVERLPLAQIRQTSMYRRECDVNQAADLIVVGSVYESRELRRVFGVDGKRFRVVYRGVDHEVFYPRKVKRLRGIIGCGRMAPIKDFPFLVKTIAAVRRTHPDLLAPRSCAIVGGTAWERDQIGLPQLIDQQGLSEYIEAYDARPQEQLATMLSRYMVFAGTSKHETFGLLPVEARACGTPTVVRDNSAYPEIPGAREGGLVSSNSSPEAFARDLSSVLLSDEQSWNRLSQAALETSYALCWSQYAKQHRSVYEELVRQYSLVRSRTCQPNQSH